MKDGDLLICAECERLWSNYQRSTDRHKHAVNRLKSESPSAGKAAALLIQQVNEADQARKKAKDALENHQLASGHH
jgi:hypothetical protein